MPAGRPFRVTNRFPADWHAEALPCILASPLSSVPAKRALSAPRSPCRGPRDGPAEVPDLAVPAEHPHRHQARHHGRHRRRARGRHDRQSADQQCLGGAARRTGAQRTVRHRRYAARQRRPAADADRHARNPPVHFRARGRSSPRRLARQHEQGRRLSAGRRAIVRQHGKLRALRQARHLGQSLRRQRRRDDGAEKTIRGNRQAARRDRQNRRRDRRPDREGDFRRQGARLATHDRGGGAPRGGRANQHGFRIFCRRHPDGSGDFRRAVDRPADQAHCRRSAAAGARQARVRHPLYRPRRRSRRRGAGGAGLPRQSGAA